MITRIDFDRLVDRLYDRASFKCANPRSGDAELGLKKVQELVIAEVNKAGERNDGEAV